MKLRPAKSPIRRPGSTDKRAVLIMLGCCLVLIIAGALWLRHQADTTKRQSQAQAYQADKTLLAEVEAHMQAAYESMIVVAGTPATHEVTKGCSRIVLKFEQGQLSCGITHTFGYGADSYGHAVELTQKIQSSLAGSPAFHLTSASKSANDLQANDQLQRGVTIRFTGDQDVRCELDFEYGNPASQEGFKTLAAERAALYFFDCSKDMVRPVYPLAE